MGGRPKGWRISCEGDTDLYDVETIDGHLAKWREMLEAVEIEANLPLAPAAGRATANVAGGGGACGFMRQAELEAKARNIVRFNEDAPGTPIIAPNHGAGSLGLGPEKRSQP